MILTITNTISGNIFGVSPTVFKFIILFAVLFIIGLYIVFHPNSAQKKDASKKLRTFADILYIIISANIDHMIESDTSIADYNKFKELLINNCKDDAWDYIHTVLTQEVDNEKIDPMIRRLIDKKAVDEFVDNISNNSNMINEIHTAFDNMYNKWCNKVNEDEDNAAKEAAKAEAEPEELDKASDETVEAFGNTSIPEGVNINDLEEETNEEPEDDDNDPHTVG